MFQMRGVIPPMLTPFQENGEVDYEGIKALVGFLRDRVDGLFITGSYGGGVLMTPDERMLVTETVIKAAGGKIPVIVQTGTADSRSTAKLTAHAAAAGAAAVSAVGPYYYKHNEDEICAFYSSMVKAAGEETPVYVYNNPGFQGYPMELKTIKKLKDTGVRGIKDATFDIMLHANYMRLLKGSNVAVGVCFGMQGIYTGHCQCLSGNMPENVQRRDRRQV